MRTLHEVVGERLEKGRFDEINVSGWELVIRDLLVTEEQVSDERRNLPKLMPVPDPRVGAAMHLALDTREMSAAGAAYMRLRKSLPTAAKELFSVALTRTVSDFYSRVGGGEDDLWRFEFVLGFARMFEGALDSSLAEKIILDDDVPVAVRLSAGNHLLVQSFKSQPNSLFWDRIEAMVGKHPEFAPFLMEGLMQAGKPHDVIGVLGKIPQPDVEQSQRMLSIWLEAYDNLMMAVNGRELFDSVMRELPRWAREHVYEMLQAFRKG